jgi:hypothetical protein
MNNKKKTTTNSKFKIRKPLLPHILIKRIFLGFKKRNAYRYPSFWLGNLLFIFIAVKAYQFSQYVKQFTVAIPREELINNMMITNLEQFKVMKPDALHKFLDDLEESKEKRKLEKQKMTNIKKEKE